VKRSVLITAGPTRENIDPVRFLSNYSTGTFGYEIAKEARRRGCDVTLVSGPTSLEAPKGVKLIRVESAREMKSAVLGEFRKHDCIVMAAAVSDWRVSSAADKKIKRRGGGLVLELVENPDIAAWVGKRKGRRVLVGFALESCDLKKNALKKLKTKNFDIVAANLITKNRSAFGNGKSGITIFDSLGGEEAYSGRSKRELAKIILDKAFRYNIGLLHEG
jgi:phosphopantothenoylcysteine decarboxylase/phosphopantothenate--cysteine ligase